MTYLGELCFNLSEVMKVYWTISLLEPFIPMVIAWSGFVLAFLWGSIIMGVCGWYLWEEMIDSHMKSRKETLSSYTGQGIGLKQSYNQMSMEDDALIEGPLK